MWLKYLDDSSNSIRPLNPVIYQDPREIAIQFWNNSTAIFAKKRVIELPKVHNPFLIYIYLLYTLILSCKYSF